MQQDNQRKRRGQDNTISKIAKRKDRRETTELIFFKERWKRNHGGRSPRREQDNQQADC